MADIHILAGDGRDRWTVVFHFPVPNVDNAVGINYRTVLVNSGAGGTSRMAEGTGPGQIAAAELAQIVAGEVFEHSLSWLAESGATNNAELLAIVRTEYARHEPVVIAALQRRLKYYGWSGVS